MKIAKKQKAKTKKQDKSAIAIVGGIPVHESLVGEIKNHDYVIGVDRGAHWLLTHKITPNIAIGDFDSVSEEEYSQILENIGTVDRYDPKKDQTDLELAVGHAVSLHPATIMMYGVLGKRFDHSVSAVQLLERCLIATIDAVIVDYHNKIQLIRNTIALSRDRRYQYVSVLPYTDDIMVTLNGFAYDVQHETVRRGQSLGLSNEVRVKQGTIRVEKGIALVVQSRD